MLQQIIEQAPKFFGYYNVLFLLQASCGDVPAFARRLRPGLRARLRAGRDAPHRRLAARAAAHDS